MSTKPIQHPGFWASENCHTLHESSAQHAASHEAAFVLEGIEWRPTHSTPLRLIGNEQAGAIKGEVTLTFQDTAEPRGDEVCFP